MKRFNILSLLILLVASASGQSVVNSRNRPILEIVTRGIGMVYPTGDCLDLRLYEGGLIEYDLVPGVDIASTNSNAALVRKRSVISSSQSSELISLAESKDFLEAATSRYPSIRKHVDDYWITKVIYINNEHTKQITVTNFWDIVQYPEDESKYPPSLVKLIKFAAKLTGRKIPE